VRLKDVVLMTYGALAMQAVMIDETDPAGLMNPAAARYFQQNRDLIPLSAAPFLSPASPGAPVGTGIPPGHSAPAVP
jgi:hypothetical protein